MNAPKRHNNNNKTTTTKRDNSEKLNKQLRSATSLTSKNEKTTNTNKPKLTKTSQTTEENYETEKNLNGTKETDRKVSTETGTSPENQQIQTNPSPNVHVNRDNNKIRNQEYNHFLLRILEDILRNTVNDEEINKIIKSHIQANKKRLNEERMVQETEDLKKRLNLNKLGCSEDASEISDITLSNSTTTSDTDTLENHTVSDSSEPDSILLNDKETVTSIPAKKSENTALHSNNEIVLHKSPENYTVQTISDYSHPFYCKKLILKLQLDDRDVADDDDDYVIIDGPLYLPKKILENQCVPVLLQDSSTNLQKSLKNDKKNENKPIVSYDHDKNLPNTLLAQKLLEDDYDLTPEKETQQPEQPQQHEQQPQQHEQQPQQQEQQPQQQEQQSSNRQITDYQTDEDQNNDDNFKTAYRLLYQDAATSVTSKSLLSLTNVKSKSLLSLANVKSKSLLSLANNGSNQHFDYTDIFTKIFMDDDFEDNSPSTSRVRMFTSTPTAKRNKRLTRHLYQTNESPLKVRLFDDYEINQSDENNSESLHSLDDGEDVENEEIYEDAISKNEGSGINKTQRSKLKR